MKISTVFTEVALDVKRSNCEVKGHDLELPELVMQLLHITVRFHCPLSMMHFYECCLSVLLIIYIHIC